MQKFQVPEYRVKKRVAWYPVPVPSLGKDYFKQNCGTCWGRFGVCAYRFRPRLKNDCIWLAASRPLGRSSSWSGGGRGGRTLVVCRQRRRTTTTTRPATVTATTTMTGTSQTRNVDGTAGGSHESPRGDGSSRSSHWVQTTSSCQHHHARRRLGPHWTTRWSQCRQESDDPRRLTAKDPRKNRRSAASATPTSRRENPVAKSILRSFRRPTQFFVPRDFDLWPFVVKINGFTWLMVDHVYVKFGDPSCICFLRYRVKKQTDRPSDRRIRTYKRWLPYSTDARV